jgi:hypothetical protein
MLVCETRFGGGFQEDAVLLAHVNRALAEAGCDDDEKAMGAEAWKAVADTIPGRTAKQCRERSVLVCVRLFGAGCEGRRGRTRSQMAKPFGSKACFPTVDARRGCEDRKLARSAGKCVEVHRCSLAWPVRGNTTVWWLVPLPVCVCCNGLCFHGRCGQVRNCHQEQALFTTATPTTFQPKF